jgi:hypothetical protein
MLTAIGLLQRFGLCKTCRSERVFVSICEADRECLIQARPASEAQQHGLAACGRDQLLHDLIKDRF